MILPAAKMRSTREALSTCVPLEACSGKRFALSESTMMIRYEGILDKLHFIRFTQQAMQLRPQTVSSEVAGAFVDFVGEVDAEMEQGDCDSIDAGIFQLVDVPHYDLKALANQVGDAELRAE